MIIRCPNCKGTQTIPETVIVAGDMPVTVRKRCIICNGVGYLTVNTNAWKPGFNFWFWYVLIIGGVLAISFYGLWVSGRTPNG